MAKIIQFEGKYLTSDKYEEINLNADCITSIVSTNDRENKNVSCINLNSYNGIYTKLSIEEIVRLVNDWFRYIVTVFA